jgi:hypothetical protein
LEQRKRCRYEGFGIEVPNPTSVIAHLWPPSFHKIWLRIQIL